MLLIYTGNGKGKTSACIGQAIRAYGNDMQVAFAHFMKENTASGEQIFLTKLLGENYLIGGEGFFFDEAEYPKHRHASLKTLAWAKAQCQKNIQLLVLDEALYALNAKLISEEEIFDLIDLCTAKNIHLVLSGRGLSPSLAEKADLISEIQPIKHPFERGIAATKGIEF